jgi:WD40 repeat protein
VRWWDTAAWVLRGGLSGHPVEDAEVDVPQADCGRVLSLAYTPDTRALVLGTSAGVLWWDVLAGKPRGPFAQQGCCSLALSLDGKTLVSADGRTAHVWSVAWGTRRATLQGHKGVVTSVALSPDGRRVLTGSMDGSVRLWEAASGRQVAALDWEVGAPHCVVFALDGMRAAVGGARGAVVWDVE